MPMTPQDFFDGFVSEDYEDWKEEPTSIRRAFHASVSAFHLADHYYVYYAKKLPAFEAKYRNGLEKFQNALVVRQPKFKVIQDVANTYKHLYPRARCSISSGVSISSVTLNGKQIGEDWDEQSGGYINIRHRDGSETKFSTSIDAVFKMWADIMDQQDPLCI